MDSQSTVDLFCNSKLLVNVRSVAYHLNINCNAGKVRKNMMGDLPGYGPVWYYADGIANILSLFLVAQRFHIQYDNRTSPNFRVWKENGTCREFKPGSRGLHYCDVNTIYDTVLTEYDETLDVEPDKVATVKENLKRFNNR